MKLIIPFLRQILQGGLALVLLTPFVYTDSTTFPFVFGKVIALRILVEVVALCWVALLLFDPSSRPRRSPVLFGIALVALAYALATVFGVDTQRSFWGNQERMGGLFSLLHALILAPISATVLRNRRDWYRFFWWGLATANLMAVIGLVQHYSSTSFLLANVHGRIWATLGNFIYLGQYSLFFALLAVYVAYASSRISLRLAALGTSALQIIIMLLAETRGVLVGFVAAVVLLLAWIWFRRGVFSAIPHRLRLATGVSALLIGISLFFFGHALPGFSRIPGFRRITFQGFTAAVGGTSTRLIAWGIALDAWRARPVFGWGIENYNYAFNLFYRPESLRYSFYETWFDRPHNGYLELLSTAGAAGVLAAAYLYYGTITTLLRDARRGRPEMLRAGFALAIWVSYQVQLAFVFDSATSIVLISLFYGWVLRIGWGDAPAEPVPEKNVSAAALNGKFLLVGAATIAALLLIFFGNIQPLRANQLGLQSAAAVQLRGDLSEALSKQRAALSIPTPYRRDLNVDFARDVMQGFSSASQLPPTARAAWEQAVAGLEENIARSTIDAYEYILLGQLYNLGILFDPNLPSRAEAILAKAIELSPRRQQTFFTFAKTKLLLHKPDEAVALLKQAVSFDDHIAESHWYYALALSDAGHRDQAFQEMKIALNLGYLWGTPIETIWSADLAREFGDFRDAYAYLLTVSSTYENAAEYQARVAEAAAGLGDRVVAARAANRAVELDPKLKTRLSSLLGGR